MTTVSEPQARQEMASGAYAFAFEHGQKHRSCRQCVLAAIRDALGTDDRVELMETWRGLNEVACTMRRVNVSTWRFR